MAARIRASPSEPTPSMVCFGSRCRWTRRAWRRFRPRQGGLSSAARSRSTFPAGACLDRRWNLSVGIAGAAPGRRRPRRDRWPARVSSTVTGADLSLYPDPPGLGQLADAALTKALPFVLDHLAEQTGSDLAGHGGAVVRAARRRAGPAHRHAGAFQPDRLQAWADDPAGSLRAALPTLTATRSTAIASAAGPLLPAGASASVVDDELCVVGPHDHACVAAVAVCVTLGGTVAAFRSSRRSTFASISMPPASRDSRRRRSRGYRRWRRHAPSVRAGGRRVTGRRPTDRHRPCGRRAAHAPLPGAGISMARDFRSWPSTEPPRASRPQTWRGALVEAVLDVVASFRWPRQRWVLLSNPVGSSTVRDVLRDVVLDPADPARSMTASSLPTNSSIG